MHVLTETEFRLKAEPALRQVFVNDDAFDQPFSPNIAARKIVYPCIQYIEPLLMNAIVAAASKNGDTGCYIYDIWAGEQQRFYIPFSELSEVYFGIASETANRYELNMSLSSENVIYSPNGKWGIVISHEWHGMLGGSVAFIEQIHQSIPNLEQQVYDFIEDRLRRPENGKFGSTVLKILPKMLMHVYGQTKAEKILQDIGLNRKYWQTG